MYRVSTSPDRGADIIGGGLIPVRRLGELEVAEEVLLPLLHIEAHTTTLARLCTTAHASPISQRLHRYGNLAPRVHCGIGSLEVVPLNRL